MPANERSTKHTFDTGTYGDAAFNPADDAPDLSSPEWVAKFAKGRLQRGRPKAGITKVSTTLRLDPDVLERFKTTGPGWQSRMNDALRRAVGLAPNP